MVADSSTPAPKKMLRLTVIVKARDSFKGKPMVDVLIELYKQAGISGATVTHAARGFGARGVSRSDVLGLSVNLPTIIETVADYEKVGKVIPEIRRMVGSNGLVTTSEVNVY
jgi:uncharacterized protein